MSQSLIAIDIISLFPEMFDAITQYGVTRRAFDLNVIDYRPWQLRDFAPPPHQRVDDRPYGGGPGMVMQPQPIADAIDAAKKRQQGAGFQPRVIYFSPQGRVINEALVSAITQRSEGEKDRIGLVLLCGRYEGVDQRLMDEYVDEFYSLGDFVLSGGELPAMALIDAIARRLPGVLNDAESAQQESFATGILDWPHYTRPEVWRGLSVPAVLLGGNHAEIAKWREQAAIATTQTLRPDLLESKKKQALHGKTTPKKPEIKS